jgi:hypothetical protein
MSTTSFNVLVGSTVRQKPAILKEFLNSLSDLDCIGIHTDFIFIDNNDSEESSKLLKEFKVEGSTVFLGTDKPTEQYHCTEETHFWNDSLIWKIAAYKDFILRFSLEHNYSHVLMIDSDLVLHPLTLRQLLDTEKDIVSEIFWTEWMPQTSELPQVWMCGQYSYHSGGSQVPDEEKNRQTAAVITKLKTPGLYEVGGLGACTLISAKAIDKGVSYSQIQNVDYWGEDRHFCIRAAVLGFKLFVDTHYPAFHIYRESDLTRVEEYRNKISKDSRKTASNRVTLSMIVRNETGRYLYRMLEHARNYIDAAVIIDDASTDGTPELCKQVLDGIPLKIITRNKSGFSDEHKLRKQQWDETVKTNPDWILSLDSDEIFEDKIATDISNLINQAEYDWIAFRLYDFWDENHYREDTNWQAHNFYRPFLVRYFPEFTYKWQETAQHCGRFPCNIGELPGIVSSVRLKHFGWANQTDRQTKYNRYMELDPDGKYGIIEQYQSILDPAPNLIKWEE